MSKQRPSFYQYWPAILWFVLLSILVFLPGSELPSSGWMNNIHADKIAHVIMFAVLVILFIRPMMISSQTHSRKLLIIVLISSLAVAWGLAIEFIQKNFVTGRSFDLWDWAADIFGVLIGLFIYKVLLSKKRV